MNSVREISYSQALNEAARQLMELDPRVFMIGQGVNSPWYVGMTTQGLVDQFGKQRMLDTPVSENSITGMAVGAAVAGMRPVLVHPRMDFALLAMNQLVGDMPSYHYLSGGQITVPLTVRLIINRGGEQAAHHSKSLHAFFAHVPGLKVVMPSTPYDAKGLLISSVLDENPVVFIDDRWLYEEIGPVPEDMYQIPIGSGMIRREGKDITIVASSYMVLQGEKAALELETLNIDAEVIDLRTVKPIDSSLIIQSVKKTRCLLIADGGWASGGISAEVSALIAESDAVRNLKVPIRRLTLPPAPAPMASSLEDVYYSDAHDIFELAKEMVAASRSGLVS